jgi:hypothetical protein
VAIVLIPILLLTILILCCLYIKRQRKNKRMRTIRKTQKSNDLRAVEFLSRGSNQTSEIVSRDASNVTNHAGFSPRPSTPRAPAPQRSWEDPPPTASYGQYPVSYSQNLTPPTFYYQDGNTMYVDEPYMGYEGDGMDGCLALPTQRS